MGNVRILFEDKNQNGKITKLNPDENSKNPYIIDKEEIVFVNHYYPFGNQSSSQLALLTSSKKLVDYFRKAQI